MKKLKVIILIFVFFITSLKAYSKTITNETIYEKLIELEKKQSIMETKFEERFYQLEKRYQELREDMNKRFELMDRRFEDINRRFEDINRRFEQLYTFLWIITGIFTAIMVGAFGFAYWDRRTIIRKAKEETLEELKKEHKLKELYESLKELAKKDPEVKKLLEQFNLL